MSLTVDIRDRATGALQALQEEIALPAINPAIGAGVVVLFQLHLIANPPNRQGFPSTHFWADAARATHFNLLATGVIVSVSKQGMLQRYKGGDIEPTGGKKYLTIPARAEAYGKRAGEFSNLQLAFHRVGGRVEAWGLVENRATTFAFGKKRKDGSQKKTSEEVGGLVFFWLVKSVRQAGDESIIPSDEEIGERAMEVIGAAVARAFRRK